MNFVFYCKSSHCWTNGRSCFKNVSIFSNFENSSLMQKYLSSATLKKSSNTQAFLLRSSPWFSSKNCMSMFSIPKYYSSSVTRDSSNSKSLVSNSNMIFSRFCSGYDVKACRFKRLFPAFCMSGAAFEAVIVGELLSIGASISQLSTALLVTLLSCPAVVVVSSSLVFSPARLRGVASTIL